MSYAAPLQTIDLPIAGMDCAECARHVEEALKDVPGVQQVTVLLAAERATVRLDPAVATRELLAEAVAQSGYTVPPIITGAAESDGAAAPDSPARKAGELIGWGIVGLVAAVVLLAALGERLGVFDARSLSGCRGGSRRRRSRSAAGRSFAACFRPPGAGR